MVLGDVPLVSNGVDVVNIDDKMDDNKIDMIEYGKTYEIMYHEKLEAEKNLSETPKKLEQMELELGKHAEKVDMALKDNEYLRNENTRIKNENKFMAQMNDNYNYSTSCSESDSSQCTSGSVSESVASSYEEPAEYCVNTNQEISNLRDDFSRFSKFIYEELAMLKDGAGIQAKKNEDIDTTVATEDTEEADDISIEKNDENWTEVIYGRKKKSMKKPQVSLSNRFSSLEDEVESKTDENPAPNTSIHPIPKPRPTKAPVLQSHSQGPRIVPGVKKYNRAHISMTYIISDSTIGKLSVKTVRRNIDPNEDVVVKIPWCHC